MNLQVVSELNNTGLSYLEAGDLRHALENLSDALKCTMGALGPEMDHQSLEAARCASLCSNPPATMAKAGRHPPTTTPNHQPKPHHIEEVPSETKPPSVPFAYASGINLIPWPAAYSPDPLINTTIISSIIIFNLSIIYHLKGLETVSMSAMRLNKAKTLYLKSQHLLVDAGVPLGSTGNPVIDMLSMALFNNLAHVTFEMGSYEESRKQFDHLIRFALTVIPSRYGDAYVGSHMDQQKSNFLLNAIILQAPKLAAAA